MKGHLQIFSDSQCTEKRIIQPSAINYMVFDLKREDLKGDSPCIWLHIDGINEPVCINFDTSRMFPIQRGYKETHDITGIPWDCIAEHEPQMLKNHEQSLERMAARAGLGIHEAYMVLTDTPISEFFKYPDNFKSDVCAEGVKAIVRDWQRRKIAEASVISPDRLTIEGIYDELSSLPERARAIIAELVERTQTSAVLSTKYNHPDDRDKDTEIFNRASQLKGGR